jgi:hypothetical protein
MDPTGIEAVIAVVLDAEMNAVLVLQGFEDAFQPFAFHYDLVLGQRENERLTAGCVLPTPAIEPSERKPLGGAVGLGENQGMAPVVDVTAVRFRD